MLKTVKRVVPVLATAAACAAVPLILASPAAADDTPKDCPWGTKLTHWNTCVSGQGTAAAPIIPVPPPSGGGPNIVNNPNGFDSVNGVPCTPEHYGTCYGMAQNP
jgi:hypothetical protein